MARKRGPIDASELMAELEADPEFRRRRAQKDKELSERVAMLREAERSLVAELGNQGYDVESVWDFVNTSESYPDAIPILLKHMKKAYPDRLKEGIARALAVPEAKFALSTLVEEYEYASIETQKGYKDGLAVAIAAASDDRDLPDVIRLLRDRNHGESRILLLDVLRYSKDPRAKELINELSNDPDLEKEIHSWR